MTLSNDFEIYKNEIKLILAQNPVECELYSIISCIIRARKNSANISLRDVSTRRRSELSKMFYGKSGFPDFVILTQNFDMHAPKKDEILGAIEAKSVLNSLMCTEQLKGHIDSFYNVIYTNGLKWEFYNSEEFKKNNEAKWTVELGKKDNMKIDWKTNLEWRDLLNKLDNILWIKKKTVSVCEAI